MQEGTHLNQRIKANNNQYITASFVIIDITVSTTNLFLHRIDTFLQSPLGQTPMRSLMIVNQESWKVAGQSQPTTWIIEKKINNRGIKIAKISISFIFINFNVNFVVFFVTSNLFIKPTKHFKICLINHLMKNHRCVTIQIDKKTEFSQRSNPDVHL